MSQNEFNKALDKALKHNFDKGLIHARLGKPDGTIFYTDPSTSEIVRDHVWATLTDSNSNANTVRVVRNRRVLPQWGLYVILRHGPDGILEVHGEDSVMNREFTGGRNAEIPAHAWAHSITGADTLYIDSRQVLPLAVTPRYPADLYVTVYPYYYIYYGTPKYYAGGSIDLSSYHAIIGGTQSFVILCLNTATNAIVVVNGTNATPQNPSWNYIPFTGATVAAVSIADGYIPIAAVRLYSSQTRILWPDIFMDLRDFSGSYNMHARQHGIDSGSDHIGVAGAVEDNFMAFNASGLPKDSGYDATDFATASHAHDADVITYTPAVLADWASDADPGDTNDALDQLAQRLYDAEQNLSWVPGGRLSTSSTDPYASGSGDTLYYLPAVHNKITLHGGMLDVLTEYTIPDAGVSLAVPSTASFTLYDIFIYSNAGTLTLEAVAWTDTSTRATALAYKAGFLVKDGTYSRRYLGTIGTTNTVGSKLVDGITQRFLFNMYNRVWRRLTKTDTTTHTYSSTTVRYYNNDSTNKIEFVSGIVDDDILINIYGDLDGNDTTAAAYLGHDIDASTSVTATVAIRNGNAYRVGAGNSYGTAVTEGYHYIALTQQANGSGVDYNTGGIRAVIRM